MSRGLIVCLSGEICSGKSTLAKGLSDRFGFEIFNTKSILEGRTRSGNRTTLQRAGEELDEVTDGRWVLENFQRAHYGSEAPFAIDAIRIYQQIRHLRTAFSYRVLHIHLESEPEILFQRYSSAYTRSRSPVTVKREYSRIKKDKTESSVRELREKADLFIDTGHCTIEDVLVRAASFLGLLPALDEPLVDVVIGAQFGSEGKGQICGYLAPEYDALMRVGGPNAGHTVYEEPKKNVFHMLPAGSSRSSHAKLLIGPGAVLNLPKLLEEISFYKIETDRLVIDEQATIISENDIIQDKKLVKAIGSTGQGVGPATANNILNRTPSNNNKASFFGKELKGFLGSTHEELERLFARGARVLLEGTQGTGLSIHHGIYPYVTSRDTTISGCLAESGIAPRRVRRIIMVTRTYPIRVADPLEGDTSGPFMSEVLSWRIIAEKSGLNQEELEKSELTTTTHNLRRVAEFGWTLFRRACEINSPTDIALTFVDYLSSSNTQARRMEQLTPETIHFIQEVERCAGVQVSLISTRFEYRSIIDRRSWKRNENRTANH